MNPLLNISGGNPLATLSPLASLPQVKTAINKIPGTPLGGLVGAAGGAGGTGFKNAGGTNITPGTTSDQIQQSYGGAQNSLQSQQALLTALQNQNALAYQRNSTNGLQNIAADLTANNAIGNQASAYNQQQALANSMYGVNGVGNQQQSYNALQGLAGQQQGLLNQYQNVANGTGPNPAQAMLAQQTGQNVANQSAMMAGQRGAASNVGLLARQAAQQGAATQQQAVGQGATMQANQQLSALQAMQGQQQAIGQTQGQAANIAAQQIGQTQNQQQALAGQANQQLAAQQAAQQAYANQANTFMGQQIGATTANTQAQQSEQQLLQNALSSQNQQNVSMQGNINSANAGLAQTQLAGQQKVVGGLLSGAGSAVGMAGAKGGMVVRTEKYADGGMTQQPSPYNPPTMSDPGPQSSIGKFLKSWAGNTNNVNQQNSDQNNNATIAGDNGLEKGSQDFSKAIGQKLMSSSSPAAPASQGTAFVGPDAPAIGEAAVLAAAKGGMAKKHDYRSGGNVKAKDKNEKAVKAGNSYANDKIPALLSEDEIVIPRDITQGKDPAKGAADFVAKVLAKKRARAS
jgi:hypothetical protein